MLRPRPRSSVLARARRALTSWACWVGACGGQPSGGPADAGPDLPAGPPTFQSAWTTASELGCTASPSLADLDGDGAPELVVAQGLEGDHVGRVRALAAADGSVLWEAAAGEDVIGSVLLADLDGDGLRDVVVGHRGSAAVALRGRDGQSLWTRDLGMWVHTPAAVGDLLFVPRGGAVDVFTPGGLSALDHAGREQWRYDDADHEVYSSPAVADLNGDGTADFVLGSGGELLPGSIRGIDGATRAVLWDYPSGVLGAQTSAAIVPGDPPIVLSGGLDGFAVALDGDGRELWRREHPGTQVVAAPGVGDLDGDGDPDVVYAPVDGTFLEPAGGHVRAYDATDGTPLWGLDRGLFVWAGPLVVGGGGAPAYALVLISLESFADSELILADGRTGAPIAIATLPGLSVATPLVADADADGELDVFVCSWTAVTRLRLRGVAPRAPWPKFRGNLENTGVLGEGTPPGPG